MSGEVVASGVVRVRSLDTGEEWDEIAEVSERELTDTDGSELTVEDVARRQASRQADPHVVETLEADIQ